MYNLLGNELVIYTFKSLAIKHNIICRYWGKHYSCRGEVGQFFSANIFFSSWQLERTFYLFTVCKNIFYFTCFRVFFYHTAGLIFCILVSLYTLRYFLHFSFPRNIQFSSLTKIKQLFLSAYKFLYSELWSILLI